MEAAVTPRTTCGLISRRPAATVTKYYYLGSQRVAMRQGGVLTYLHGDHLGSASLATNASGAKVAEQRYLPYGGTRSGSMPRA